MLFGHSRALGPKGPKNTPVSRDKNSVSTMLPEDQKEYPINRSLGLLNFLENATTCYRAPRWPDLEFPRERPPKMDSEKIPPKYPKIPKKYPRSTKNVRFGYFFRHFGGYFRVSARRVLFRYFLWKVRVGPSRGSVAGRGVLKSV